MRDRPFRTPRAPKLDWPGGIVPEWAKAPATAQRRGKGAKGARGAKDSGKRERLQKVMAQSGHGSRRNLEILIAQGHVTINGHVAKLGDLVGPGDRVKLDGKLISLRFGATLPRVLLYHKPEGEICTRDDPEGRPTVFAKLPKMNNARWVSIGRLDFNTSGLLIFTTNGELANRLMHPRYEIEREYAVRLVGVLTPEQVQRLTDEGIDLEGENCRFVRLVDKGGEGSNHWYHVVLKEGKNREVRRMFEAIGIMVSRLMRVRYGPVELPSFLKRGMMRDMAEADVVKLMEFAGMNEGAPPAETEEDEEEYAPGNVAPPGEVPEAAEEEWEEVEDELQPAHLLDDWKPREPAIVEEDDDRQPDFERLPGFNRATGSMGLPAGHRGHHPSRGPGQGPAQGAGQGQKKRRGKRQGPKTGMPGAAGAPFPGRGEGAPQGQGQGQRPPGRGGKKRRPKSGGQGGAQAVHGQASAQGQPPAQGPAQGKGPMQGQGPAAGGKGKPGRNRRNRNRGRNRGTDGGTPAGGGGEGGGQA
ncbi:MAG: pseudouridine synthase [Lysobacter sp.]|nr:pseudouridine synthase [Lysobacter sp.]